ncbi:MAG: hypothetical protein ACMUIA_01760 [bacterium]
MSKILKPEYFNQPQELIEIIADSIDEIQGGSTVLDTMVGNDEYGYIALIAAGEMKRGMLFLLNLSGHESDFMKCLTSLQWYYENQNIMQKTYKGCIDFTQPPQILFLAPCFSTGIQKVLAHLINGRVRLLKYSCFHDGQEVKMFLEEVSGSQDQDTGSASCQNTGEPSFSPCLECITQMNAPLPPTATPGLDLEKIRQEFKIDISDISDEELLALLE